MALWTFLTDRLRIQHALRAIQLPEGVSRAKALLESMKRPRLSKDYLELVRAVHGQRAKNPHLWRLLLHWTPKPACSPPSGAAGFYRHYMVVADSLEQALTFAANLEPERDWAQMQVDQWEDRGAGEAPLTGVVEASGAAWYGSP